MPQSEARANISRLSKAIGGLAAASCASLICGSANAQDSGPFVSQEVVQPLPPSGVTDLNDALRRLARNSQNVDALIDAGNASIAVNDIDAAIGFFGRAEELSPSNARVKIGLAAAYVRKQRPLDALELFDAAEKAGASVGVLSGERGLAFDLVGDNAAAQAQYRQALAIGEDDETRRRLALSHAVSGDRGEFEKVLNPLIVKEDFAAYRTRAFGLAILGDESESIALTEAVMPRALSQRIAPYLKYMPRLTKAQQAAAANLGIFPRAAQIGRDAPQIAQYTGSSSAAAAGVDARLAPQGEALGRREDSTSQRRRPDRGRSTVGEANALANPTDANVQTASKGPSSSTATAAAVTQNAEQAAPAKVAVAAPAPATRRSRRNRLDPLSRSNAQQTVRVPKPAIENASSDEAKAPAAVVVGKSADTALSKSVGGPIAASGFDLASLGKSDSAEGSRPDTSPRRNPNPVLAHTPTPAPPPVEETASVAEAFANFSLQPTSGSAVPAGGVDIRSIEPPREVVKEDPPVKAAAPKPPENPKRFWVQVATGRDRNALKFDWRRISRKVPDILGDKSAFVTEWGQSNRLLAGPFSNLRDAASAVTALKKQDVDSFTYTSPEGQEIDALK